MTETPPPRRALATFLRRPTPGEAPPAVPDAPAPQDAGPPPLTGDAAGEPTQASPLPAAPAEPLDALAPPAGDTPPTAADGAPPLAHEVEAEEATTPTPPTEPAPDWRAATLPIAAPPAPTFAQPRAKVPTPRAPAWQWVALCVLAVLLVVQILLADRARLATDARWRPLLSTLCGALRCDLPVWHEPSAFTMLDRDVRPAADQPGVLRIQASFRNDARWDQAWPYLQLSLSDADGRVIGSRVFAPAEYLGHAPPAGETLAPGQSGRIDFRVREPAAGTSAFTFDFH
ncbi:DUF3426 domain-containing protein [Stenotrophomonas sp. HITSZ_GD]|uniref:DUF3426 domain-containing protein n=1 Tax=Stenotrophomonas sp. HITSZ_GD TaxID=3037248 RepID=UPI00240D7830|nr:DUF3426 domain-containing protein [Stenotrophomonas sp. HITSZ_GD]MDG2526141.1 DUF3426 domain-containing protein [Stenotrophomonas sp. HITSZ_GD]